MSLVVCETPWNPATIGIAPSSSADWIRPGVMSMIRALPCVSSVITPACDPVKERASRPRFAIAIASSAIEIRSPAVSSMSSSRPGGAGLTWFARSRSSSVVSPMADTTTTTRLPALRVATIRWATRLMPSASPTDDPPYFCTTRATAFPVPPLLARSTPQHWTGPAGPVLAWRVLSLSGGSRHLPRHWLLSHVKPGVRDDRVERPHGCPAVRAPVVDIGVLPPPQRLGDPSRLVMPQTVDKVRSHCGKIIRKTERGRLGVGVRIEDLGIVIAATKPGGQSSPQVVQGNVGVGTNVGLGVAGQDDVLASPKLRPGQHHLGGLQQQQRNRLLCALAAGYRRESVQEVPGVRRDPVSEGPPLLGRTWLVR